jgi:GNAT superfamily N-acetyltransferase
MSSPVDVSIRTMTAGDIPAGLSLCRAARWNQTAADWEFFLSFAPEGALVAEGCGTVVGTVATVPYGPFTWISMVLVDPASRGRGVGRMLLQRGLALVPGHVTARLDATPAGEPLYRTLSFAPEYGLARWLISPDAHEHDAGVAKMDEPRRGGKPLGRLCALADWPLILQMDRHVFGASRGPLLRRLADEAPEYAWVLETGGRLRAYLFGRRGHVRDQLGPLVADTRESAQLLLESCLAAHRETSFFVDAPDRDDGWRDVLATLGFTMERSFLRMHRGALSAAGNPAVVFGVIGPEFG